MPFTSGRVSYSRFRVSARSGGEGYLAIDDGVLDRLREHRFEASEIGVPEEAEVGWTTGEHLFDTDFSYEKNGFGQPGSAMLHAALRIDTHRVPADIKRAYQKMNERAAAAGNPSGFASKEQKREAKDETGEQLARELADGRYRKSKTVPVFWDMERGVVHAAATSQTLAEHLQRMLRHTFDVEVEAVTAGSLAGHHLASSGSQRDYEDLRPSAFMPPPPAARGDGDDLDEHGERRMDLTTPPCPWIATAVDVKDFLGNEFLIWLWWLTETHEGGVDVREPLSRATRLYVAIDKSLDMDCAWAATGKQTLRVGGPTRLVEAGDALALGKWPRKMGLILADEEQQWELTLQGDTMNVSAAMLPDIEDAAGPRELVEARLALTRGLSDSLDALYTRFINDRTGGGWATKREAIRGWIRERRG